MALRSDIIQALLELFDAPHYLEVGVHSGTTFLPLRAARKVGVDPTFRFDTAATPQTDGTVLEYHETTSDDYFGRIIEPGTLFDVIFLDGLHTFDQTLRDLMNAICFLKPEGVIVLDDVIPNSYQASLPDPSEVGEVRAYMAALDPRLEGDQAHMGDVFKLVFFVQSYMQQFRYATTAEQDGQTVLWRQRREQGGFAVHTMESIGNFQFKDFIRCRNQLKIMPLDSILAAIHASQTGRNS